MKIEVFKTNEENVLWTGKANKAVYIKECIFTPLLLFALIWLAIDCGVIFGFIFGMGSGAPLYFIIPFFILHLMPVWIYLFRVIFSFVRWKNLEYMVTDKAVYCLSGVFTTNCVRKTFQEITNVSVHQGIIDKHHNVGDVFIIANGKIGVNIVDIEDYLEVYKLITKTSTDIYSDTMFPNDYRPKENHGYQTEYRGNEKQ